MSLFKPQPPDKYTTALTLGENAFLFVEELVSDLETAVEAAYDAESEAQLRVLEAEADKADAKSAQLRYGTLSMGLRSLLGDNADDGS